MSPAEMGRLATSSTPRFVARPPNFFKHSKRLSRNSRPRVECCRASLVRGERTTRTREPRFPRQTYQTRARLRAIERGDGRRVVAADIRAARR